MTHIEQLVREYTRWAGSREFHGDVPVVQVDRIAARIASFYERMRKIVGWSEEHLLRKTAITRILRRSILLARQGDVLADVLVRDLVRGGYFPNGTIPESKIPVLQKVLEKYLFLFGRVRELPGGRGRGLENWLYQIAGCEVEAFLDPPIREEALLEFMTEDLKARLVVQDGLSEQVRENLIFIAVRQALMKFDETIITFELLTKYIQNWTEIELPRDREVLERFAHELPRWRAGIRASFRHSAGAKFYWAAEALDTPYLILGDTLTELAAGGRLSLQAVQDFDGVREVALERYAERRRRGKRRAFRAAFFSTISILITKVLVAFAIEVPVDRWMGVFNSSALIANVVIPPALLIVILLFGLTPPPRNNAERVMRELEAILTGTSGTRQVKLRTRRRLWVRGFVALMYVVGGIATFSALIYALTALEFSPFSQAVFILFLSLISFSGVRIRERSKELVVNEKPPGFFHDVALFFTFPIIELGRWLSGQFLRVQFIAIALDVFVELPFRFFVEFIEQWRGFLREKEEGIR